LPGNTSNNLAAGALLAGVCGDRETAGSQVNLSRVGVLTTPVCYGTDYCAAGRAAQ